MACDLTVLVDKNNAAPISGNDRWVASRGSTRSSAAVSDDLRSRGITDGPVTAITVTHCDGHGPALVAVV